MFYVILFEKEKPHINENLISGFYTENYDEVCNYLRIIDLTSCEVVIVEENDTEVSN